jgi:hypothetical protein
VFKPSWIYLKFLSIEVKEKGWNVMMTVFHLKIIVFLFSPKTMQHEMFGCGMFEYEMFECGVFFFVSSFFFLESQKDRHKLQIFLFMERVE